MTTRSDTRFVFHPSFALCIVFSVSLCLCGSTSFAASPSLGGIYPRGAQRGTDAVLFFNGARLADAQEILYFTPGFSTTKLEAVNDNQIKVTVKIAPDCRLGEHAARLRTKTGLSELRTFWVGALPVVEEKEPNSDFTAPQKIPLNVTVHGVVDNEDVDYYAIELKKGQRLTAEIEAMRLGEALFDPYIAILDSKRFELASSDDAPLLGQDATASILAPADGTYIVQVRESAYGGNGGCRYRLHVGTFPRPLAVVPAGGKLGEEIEVRFLGDPTGEIRQKIKLPTTFDSKFGIFAQDAGGISPSPIPFHLSEVGNVIETDGNINHQTATKFDLPNAVNGVIAKPGEVDHYRFLAKKGQTFDVHCYARRLGSPLDSVMSIAVFGGGIIASNDDAIGPDSYFRWTAPEDREYVLTITDHLRKGGPTYFYRVEFQPVAAMATVTIPKVALYSQDRQTIVVPRGNRYATFVTVSRGNFGGDVVVGVEGLPPGVTLNAETMPANLDTIPVVFEAAAAATLGGKLTPLTARHVDPKQPIGSHHSQQVELISGPPGQSVYWKYEVDKAAIAVTDEVPFKINIIEPKVPLVQNGSLNLRVVAERQAGFKGAITVLPLVNIPGVGTASSAVIAENQTETTLVMNAAPNAQVRKWKMAVIATATVGNGPVWVSSQLANLEVAAPFLALAMERAAAEQGKNTEIFCKVQQLTPFTGSAKVSILGLPTKVAAPDLEITKDTKELAFKVTVDKTSPAGQHRNIFCQVVLMQNGEPILMNTGGTELRIDVPLPPKSNTPPPTPTKVTAKPPEQPTKPPEKRLTRLEKLRLEQEEREKAAQVKKN
jgi:Bacterial pre-peptidase C-terminal domain